MAEVTQEFSGHAVAVVIDQERQELIDKAGKWNHVLVDEVQSISEQAAADHGSGPTARRNVAG